MTRTKRLSRDLTALAAILIAVLLPLAVYILLDARKTDNTKTDNNAKVAFVQQCGTDNDTRTSVKHIVDKLAVRSKISSRANRAAPNQTPAQRAATAKSLKIIQNLQDYAHDQLALKVCIYPAPPTTTTRRAPPTSTTQFPIKRPPTTTSTGGK